MRKQIMTLTITCILLTGCSKLDPELDSFTMPEKKEVNTVTEEAKSAVERMAEQKHVKPKLSDEFISEYLNMDDFDELKRRTKAGIAITNDTADMTKEEILLWMDIVRSKWFNQYTVTDLEEKKKEFDGIIQEMAEEADMSIREMMALDYGLGEDEAELFLERQAEKYVDCEQENE